MAVVLIIEDDDETRSDLVEAVGIAGLGALSAKDGLEGIELFRKHKPQVVLTDLNLPKASGIDILAIIQKEAPETQVIVMTGDNRQNTVQLEVSEKIGANLSICKPIDPTTLVDKLRKVDALVDSGSRKPRVLVVDDEEDIRLFLTDSLEMAGIDSEEAANGEEAYALFEEQEFDLVITDIYMPKMNGIDLIRKIREKSDVPIVTISGASSQSLKSTKMLGASETFQKPFNPDELIQCIVRLGNSGTAA